MVHHIAPSFGTSFTHAALFQPFGLISYCWHLGAMRAGKGSDVGCRNDVTSSHFGSKPPPAAYSSAAAAAAAAAAASTGHPRLEQAPQSATVSDSLCTLYSSTDDDEQWCITRAKSMHMHRRELCVSCQQPPHANMSCEDARRAGVNEAGSF